MVVPVLSVPSRVPALVGLKVTVIVQVLGAVSGPGTNTAGQVLVVEWSAGVLMSTESGSIAPVTHELTGKPM